MQIGAFFFFFKLPSLHAVFRLFLDLMIHSCHGLKPHHIILRPDLHNTNALDSPNRADSKDQDLHLNFLLTQRDQNLTYTACLFKIVLYTNSAVWVCMHACFLIGVWQLLQAFPSFMGVYVCACVCVHM